MSDEKADCFEIYITENGPKLVKGSGRIEVLHAIDRQSEHHTMAVELCNITCCTDQPKSSVFSSLESMVKSGVLRNGLVNGKKGYRINGFRLIMHADQAEDLHGIARRMADADVDVDSFASVLFMYIGCVSLANGMDPSPLFKSIGRDIGRRVLSESGSAEEAVEKLRRMYSDADIADIGVLSLIPPTIETVFRRECPSDDFSGLMAMLTASSLASALVSENRHELTVDRHTCSGNRVVTLLRYCDPEKEIDLIPSEFCYSDSAESGFIRHISNDGEVRLMTNPLSIAIMDLMPANTPMSSADITRKLDESVRKPQSSVLFYLEKMIDAGILTDVRINGKRRFVKATENLFVWDKGLNKFPYEIESAVDGMIRNPSQAAEILLEMFVKKLGSLCINARPIVCYMARRFARELCDSMDSKNIESAIGRLAEIAWFRYSDVSIVSFFPFTMIRRFEHGVNEITEYMMHLFDAAFFREILKIVGNAEYGAECDRIDNDLISGYRIVFRQIQ